MNVLQTFGDQAKQYAQDIWRLCMSFFSKNSSRWNALSRKQRIIIASVGSVSLVSTLLWMKARKDKRKFESKVKDLQNEGYLPTDAVTTLFGGLSKFGADYNVHSFHVMNDDFDFNKCVEFWTNMAIEYLPFRSVLQYKLNTYFWIECVTLRAKLNLNSDYNINYNEKKLTESLTRSQFHQQYGFDVADRIKLS